MMIPSPLATPNVTETSTSTSTTRSRPMLVKQKQSFQFPDPADADDHDESTDPVPVPQEETQSRDEGSGSGCKSEADPEAQKDESVGFKKVEKEKVKSAPVSFERADSFKWSGGRGKVLKQSSLDVEFMADRERLQVGHRMVHQVVYYL